jgi:hypothetical protein
MFFNEVVGEKIKHKNQKAIWFEYNTKMGSNKPSGYIDTLC